MADHTAFFYGTLMVPKILYRVCFGTTTPQPHQTQFLSIRPAILHDHRRHRVRHADYPGIIPVKPASDPSSDSSSSASVLGTYVVGLTPQDLYRLDCFEGDEYARRDVSVRILRGGVAEVQEEAGEGDGGELVRTQTYIYLDPEGLEEKEWDFEEFKREKMGVWTMESSEEYHDIPYNEEAGSKHDGTGGRGAGGQITRQLENEGIPAAVTRSAV